MFLTLSFNEKKILPHKLLLILKKQIPELHKLTILEGRGEVRKFINLFLAYTLV
jgi:hypothetical protein